MQGLGVIDLVAQDEIGAGVAGAGDGELVAECGQGLGAAGCGEGVEPDEQLAGADVAGDSQGLADQRVDLGQRVQRLGDDHGGTSSGPEFRGPSGVPC
jgi:hypothetical protein